MSIVESFVPGRIRLRSSLLHDGETAAMLQGAMSAIPGVQSADLNAATGSLLLKYDADALPLEKLSPLLPLLEQVKALDNEPPSPKRTAALRSLLVQVLVKVL
ncbi:MAG: cation transporter [Pyramidobacter sp.]|nr:cation transporter [Pyramidobacter sp.]